MTNIFHSWILVFVGLLQWTVEVYAASDITLNSVKISTGFVVSSTPGSIIISTTHTTGDSQGPVVYTFDTALFGATKTPACSASLSTGTATYTCTTSANGLTVTATLTGGVIAPGATMTFTITDSAAGDIAALPSTAATVQMNTLTANAGGDTLAGGSRDIFRVVSAATITLTSADMNAGTTPTGLQVQFTTPVAVSSTQNVVIAATQAVFTASVTAGLTDPGSIFSSYSTTDTQTFTGVLSGNIALNTAVDFTMPVGMMAVLPSVAGAVTLDISLNGDLAVDDATGFGTIVYTAATVSGDPVSWYGNLRTEFLLPIGQHTLLLQTPDMIVVAWPFQGKGEDQWIGKVVVASKTGDSVVEVDVQENLMKFDRNKIKANSFETLDVIIGPSASPSRLGQIPDFDEQVDHPEGLVLKFGRVTGTRGPVCLQDRYFPCRETVIVISKYAKVFIESSSAVEYFGSSRDAVDHAHLDVQVTDMFQPESFSGALPEMWGLRPISASTKAMIKSQVSVSLDLNATTAVVRSNASEDLSTNTAKTVISV